MYRRCYTTISDDLFINGLKLFAMTFVTISDESVVTDGIIIATTKCRY